jgi:hypothetical protein
MQTQRSNPVLTTIVSRIITPMYSLSSDHTSVVSAGAESVAVLAYEKNHSQYIGSATDSANQDGNQRFRFMSARLPPAGGASSCSFRALR